jgi:uncharacterized protein YndB with AHSA1/START domain
VEKQIQIEKEILVDASAETVFSYFTDPQKMTRWMGLTASIDPTPGGVFRVDINGRDIMRGEFRQVDPPSSIIVTFGWEGEESSLPPGSSTVEFTFTPRGDQTLVRLRHFNLPEGMIDSHTEGWTHYFDRLAIAAVGRDPGPDPHAAKEEMEA